MIRTSFSAGQSSSSVARRRGFTLIEMVVVVLILGIVAAVAVPKLFGSADNASKQATRQKLNALRTALVVYSTQNNGQYPKDTAGLKSGLAPYLNGPFPAVAFGSNKNAEVAIDTNEDSTVDVVAGDGNQGWVYKPSNGQIKLNIKEGEGSDW